MFQAVSRTTALIIIVYKTTVSHEQISILYRRNKKMAAIIKSSSKMDRRWILMGIYRKEVTPKTQRIKIKHKLRE